MKWTIYYLLYYFFLTGIMYYLNLCGQLLFRCYYSFCDGLSSPINSYSHLYIWLVACILCHGKALRNTKLIRLKLPILKPLTYTITFVCLLAILPVWFWQQLCIFCMNIAISLIIFPIKNSNHYRMQPKSVIVMSTVVTSLVYILAYESTDGTMLLGV